MPTRKSTFFFFKELGNQLDLSKKKEINMKFHRPLPTCLTFNCCIMIMMNNILNTTKIRENICVN